MNNHKEIKKLARSDKYQVLYTHAQDMSYIRFFKNERNFIGLQLWFLKYLKLYSNLYGRLSYDNKNLTREIINDDIRMEAYLVWKEENDKKEKKENKTKRSKSNKQPMEDIPRVVFD